jgi:hypothetical protein
MRRPWQSCADCGFEIAASDRSRTGLRWSDHRLVTAVSHATLRGRRGRANLWHFCASGELKMMCNYYK